jgi:hypothetical protein
MSCSGPRRTRALAIFALLSVAIALPAGGRTSNPPCVRAGVDLRAEFAAYGIAVRQQGKRGACQVFAMVGTMEFLLARQGRAADLSEQFLMWAANAANGLDLTEGFNPDFLVAGLRRYGICEEPLMPYVPRNRPLGTPTASALRNARNRSGFDVHWIQHWTAPIGFPEHVLEAIVARLDRGSPVTVTFCWPVGLTDPEVVDADNFLIDRAIDGRDKSGHGVVLVGYQRSRAVPGGGYFILRNSWGIRFADEGHARITFAMARKYGVDAYVVAPLVRPAASG